MADLNQSGGAPTSNIELGVSSQLTKFAVPIAVKPSIRYMPTYRMDPMIPFNKEMCENIIKSVMDNTFANFTYSPKSSLQLSAQLSDEIKNRIKTQNFDRYRYVVVVTIGEKLMQGFYSVVNFLWDAEKDGYLSYVIDTPKFFAIATVYYLYYD